MQRFFAETERELVDQWIASKPDESEAREVAYRLLLLMRKFKLYLEHFLANEEFAAQELNDMLKKANV